MLKILRDNGAPGGDLQLVIDTAAGANLRSLAQLTRANEAGSDDPLRRGVLLDLHGFAIRESAGVVTHTNGTGTGYLVNNGAGYAIGDTAITVDTGSGTVLAGDVITFAGDSNNYVVRTALAANVITIAAPGLLAAVADDTAITVGADHVPNVAFHRSAVVLAARAPALPEGGDMASDRMIVPDPVSGLPFEFAIYPGYHRVYMEVAMAWGYQGIKPDHTAILMG